MSQTKKILLSSLLVLILTLFGILPSAENWATSGVAAASLPNNAYLPLIIGNSANSGPGVVGGTPTRTSTPTRTPKPTRTPTATPLPGTNDPILLAAGDIARCGATGTNQTARLLGKSTGNFTIALLGDNAYETGSLVEYQTCFDPTWGRFKSQIMPAPGNHDFLTSGGAGYYAYFGAAAHGPGGYYSYNLGAWHIVVLNSSCGDAGGCAASSQQGKWLKADLAAHPTACSLAYFHHPLFSSGEWADNPSVQPLVQLLYNAHTDVILNGHDHDYERFAPQDPNGNLDPAHGFVEIVAGTGGANHTPWTVILPNSLVRNNTTFGLIKLTLHATSYNWQFLPASGTFKDAGTANCH